MLTDEARAVLAEMPEGCRAALSGVGAFQCRNRVTLDGVATIVPIDPTAIVAEAVRMLQEAGAIGMVLGFEVAERGGRLVWLGQLSDGAYQNDAWVGDAHPVALRLFLAAWRHAQGAPDGDH